MNIIYQFAVIYGVCALNEREKQAIEHILSDYKRVLERNEVLLKENELAKQALIKNCNIADERNQLLKENEELKNKLSLKQFDINVVYNDYLEKLNEYEENSISIQKVKDKMEKLNKEIKKCDATEAIFKIKQQQTLQELIEERRKK